MNRFRQTILPILLAAGAFVGALFLQQKSADALSCVLTDDDRYYLPPAEWLRAFSLGYTEAAADMVWVKTIVYFGEKMGAEEKGEGAHHMMNYLMTATALDPKFRSCYTAGSSLTLFQAHGRVVRRSIEMAFELLEKGRKEFPDDGEIFFSLGFMHYYEMARFLSDDPEDPEAKKHRELGRYYIGRSALMPGAPPYASMLAATLMMKGGIDAAVLEHLKAMLIRETDPSIRKELIAKIRSEAGKVVDADIDETERIQQAWRADMPYVPYDLYLLLRVEAPTAEQIDPLYFTDRLLGLSEAPSDTVEGADPQLSIEL